MGTISIIILLSIAAILVGFVLLSYLIEALRRAPEPPAGVAWDPQIRSRYVEVGGVRLRYIMVGDRTPLVLFHTLRTHLDIFQKVIPALSRHFRVYAVDYPGHGFSDLPKAAYTPEFFFTSVAGFLKALDIRNAVVVGESIGGTLALLLAARANPHVAKVIAINTYDYDRGRGIHRGSALSRVAFSMSNVPVLGGTMWRSRTRFLFKQVIGHSVHHDDAIPPALMREMYEVGNRPYHYRAFMSLVRHFPKWEDARSEYGKISIPVLLLYSEHDWSRPQESQANKMAISGAKLELIKDAGHLLCLDAPEDALRSILRFTNADN